MVMPLEGIRVIDWTQWQMGPVSTVMLGDLGADVIKIEDRVRGDGGRGIMRILGVMTGAPQGRNFYFEANNRNKRGITLDLTKEKGKEIVYRLVEKSDIFVENFRKGVAERLGLGYEELRKYNDKLIYVKGSGFGPEGPDSSEPAYDYLGLARSGAMMAVAVPPGTPPLNFIGGIADQMGAVMMAYGAMVALVARERYGIGQKVDVSHLSSMMWLFGLNISQALILGKEMPREIPREKAPNPLWNHYLCGDGRWLALAHIQPDRNWPDFCRALGIEELINDPRFSDQDVRAEHCQELISILDEIFARRSRDEWMKVLRETSRDLMFTPVNTISEAAHDPQVLANEYVVEFDHPVMGKTKMLGFPIKLSETPGSIRREAPEFGQHTEEVLMEVLGMSWDEISMLKDEEVI